MGLYGALIVRPTARRCRPTTVLPLPSILNSSGAQRIGYGPQWQRHAGRLRHAQIRAEVFPDQRQGLPGHGSAASWQQRDNSAAALCQCRLTSHAMSMLGFSQTVIAQDGRPLPSRTRWSLRRSPQDRPWMPSLPSPPQPRHGTKYALYDSNYCCATTPA